MATLPCLLGSTPAIPSNPLATRPHIACCCPLTCDWVVALQGQRIVLAGTGAHQVEPALAASCREVADVLEGGADGRPGVCIGVIALHLHHVQSGACGGRGQAAGGWGKGSFLDTQGLGVAELARPTPGAPGGEGNGGHGLARQVCYPISEGR